MTNTFNFDPKGKVFQFNDNNVRFQFTWHFQLYCTYDCSYCSSNVHSTIKKFPAEESYYQTADAIIKISKLLHEHLPGMKNGVILTGGEPTANPYMLDVMRYIRKNTNEYNNTRLVLTTNGFFSEQYARDCCDTFDRITVSFHSEANDKQRDRVVKNMILIDSIATDPDSKMMGWACNMMLNDNPELYAINLKVLEDLRLAKISDKNIRLRTLDRNNNQIINRPTSAPTRHSSTKFGPKENNYEHNYDGDHLKKLYKDYNLTSQEITNNTKTSVSTVELNDMEVKDEENKPILRAVAARACCGNSDTTIVNEDGSVTNTRMVQDRLYRGWKCAIAPFWLYVQQETGLVYGQSTCKVNTWSGGRDPVCTVDKLDEHLDKLEYYFNRKQLPLVTCPVPICACGLCSPKSPTLEGFNNNIHRLNTKYDQDPKGMVFKDWTGVDPIEEHKTSYDS